MPLTDDDLKRLKEFIDGNDGILYDVQRTKIRALIVRLEAAGAFIREYENPVPDLRYRRDLLAAYYKAAGKP